MPGLKRKASNTLGLSPGSAAKARKQNSVPANSRRSNAADATSEVAPDADDLDDGLVYDFEDASFVGDEDNSIIGGDERDSNDDGLVDLIDREDEGHTGIDQHLKPSFADPATEKLRKKEKSKKNAQKTSTKKQDRMRAEIDSKKTLALLPAHAIADHLAKVARRANPELSAVELQDLFMFSQTDIEDLSGTQFSSGSSRSLNLFPRFLATVAQRLHIDLKHSPKSDSGSSCPLGLVIAQSAMRVCDLKRAVPKYISSIKAIAKNTLTQDCALITKSQPTLIIGTTDRLTKLLQDKAAFSVSTVAFVVLDVSYLDQKTNSVLDDQRAATLAFAKRVLVQRPEAKLVLF
ncbi:U3-containing 90S pre-ribosomal complex subunit-domain containing protein [Lipomyces oligophaga]|uniref:U3-containing 90S pre-ribosomal complex subunit-domain containing protein n=1 Tax=Lipomyces oligophaga TaxID=45792 RepID=UPI0034CD565D